MQAAKRVRHNNQQSTAYNTNDEKENVCNNNTQIIKKPVPSNTPISHFAPSVEFRLLHEQALSSHDVSASSSSDCVMSTMIVRFQTHDLSETDDESVTFNETTDVRGMLTAKFTQEHEIMSLDLVFDQLALSQKAVSWALACKQLKQ